MIRYIVRMPGDLYYQGAMGGFRLVPHRALATEFESEAAAIKAMNDWLYFGSYLVERIGTA